MGSNVRGRPLDTRRSEAIVAAALDVLAERGYRGFTVAKAAAAAGASTATVYRRWPTKNDLVIAAITLLARRIAGAPGLGSFPDPPDTGDVVTDMQQLVDRLIRLYTSREGALFYGLIAELRHNPALRRMYVANYIKPPRAITEATLRRGIRRGQLRDIPELPLVAEACYGLVHTRALITGEPLNKAFVRRAVQAILGPYLR